MLEHQKIILTNISKDKEMFRKELEKSVRWLSSQEVLDLYIWAKEKFGTTHYLIIKEVFSLVAA